MSHDQYTKREPELKGAATDRAIPAAAPVPLVAHPPFQIRAQGGALLAEFGFDERGFALRFFNNRGAPTVRVADGEIELRDEAGRVAVRVIAGACFGQGNDGSRVQVFTGDETHPVGELYACGDGYGFLALFGPSRGPDDHPHNLLRGPSPEDQQGGAS